VGDETISPASCREIGSHVRGHFNSSKVLIAQFSDQGRRYKFRKKLT